MSKQDFTPQQLAEMQAKRDLRTPLSAGCTADNPIFITNAVNSAFYKEDGKDWVTLGEGEELRLLACEQQKVVSPYLYKGKVLMVLNQYMDHVEGDLGPKNSDTYQLVEDEFQTV